jgi:hypothetical protein
MAGKYPLPLVLDPPLGERDLCGPNTLRASAVGENIGRGVTLSKSAPGLVGGSRFRNESPAWAEA